MIFGAQISHLRFAYGRHFVFLILAAILFFLIM